MLPYIRRRLMWFKNGFLQNHLVIIRLGWIPFIIILVVVVAAVVAL